MSKELRTKNFDISIEYLDDDKHQIIFSSDGLWCAYDVSRKEFDQLIQHMIRYTQQNREWQEAK